jgi:hypothetical protein
MTDEEIISMYCKVAGGTEWAIGGLENAMPFARMIEQIVIEQCAQVCGDLFRRDGMADQEVCVAEECAEAIRTLKKLPLRSINDGQS